MRHYLRIKSPSECPEKRWLTCHMQENIERIRRNFKPDSAFMLGKFGSDQGASTDVHYGNSLSSTTNTSKNSQFANTSVFRHIATTIDIHSKYSM